MTAKDLINKIIAEKSKGNKSMENVVKMSIKTKLTLKGVNVDKCFSETVTDQAVIIKIKDVAKELGIAV